MAGLEHFLISSDTARQAFSRPNNSTGGPELLPPVSGPEKWWKSWILKEGKIFSILRLSYEDCKLAPLLSQWDPRIAALYPYAKLLDLIYLKDGRVPNRKVCKAEYFNINPDNFFFLPLLQDIEISSLREEPLRRAPQKKGGLGDLSQYNVRLQLQ